MKYQNNRNRNYNHKENVQLDKIVLDYEKYEELFGNIAKKWSEQINNESRQQVNKSSQIRQFYDKVLELYEKSQNISANEYKQKIYPFVIMLNSKVAYAKTRGKVSQTFVDMINQCVKEAITKEKLANFKLLFEAVIGFYPKK